MILVMIKLVSVVVIIALILGTATYFRFIRQTETPGPSNIISGFSSDTSDKEDKISSLENRIEVLARQVAESSSSTPSSSPKTSTSTSLDSKIKSLETSISSLQTQINQLKNTNLTAGTNQSTNSSTTKSVTYIPLGWLGGITSTDWSSVTTQEISIDPADYPAYKNMQFEVNLRIYQGNGSAYARLLNNSDRVPISGSEVSTTSQDYGWVSSSAFTLPTGKKTYRMQLKSTTSYEAGVQNARLRVNY